MEVDKGQRFLHVHTDSGPRTVCEGVCLVITALREARGLVHLTTFVGFCTICLAPTIACRPRAPNDKRSIVHEPNGVNASL